MKKEKVAYVIIDEEMKVREWESEDDGLLPMLTNDRLFKKRYESGGIGIWEYKLYYND